MHSSQNFDPIWLAQPAIVIAFMTALVLYWRKKRTFAGYALALSFIAYFAAIAVKVIFQDLTISSFTDLVGKGNNFAFGWYYGLQTCFLEVGGAYLVARFAVSKKWLQPRDAEAYGLGLAFWENAILLGALSLFSLALNYTFLAFAGNSSIGQYAFGALKSSQPALFLPPLQALPLMGYGILERITSLLFHFSWGILVLLAAAYHRKDLFFIALPMGLLDFFVPFEPVLGIAVFELFIFILGLISILLTWRVTRSLRQSPQTPIGQTAV
jgi:hypothetical protein